MINILTNGAMLLFASLYITSVYEIKDLKSQIKKLPNQKTQPKQSNKMTSDRVIDVLNWLHQCNIIDTQTYNQLIVKILPFAE